MSANRQSALLWTPAGTRQERRVEVCRICGTELDPSEAIRHVDLCYRRNEAELRMSSPRVQHPALFGTHDVDLEFQEWHRKNPKGETFVNGT